MEAVIGLIVLVLAVGVVVLAVQYWPITLGLIAIGHLVWWQRKEQKEEERRQAVEAEQNAAEASRRQRKREEQQGYRKEMISLDESSIEVFESMPKHLSIAEGHLDQAEADFADSVFAPFWDSIEKAARSLGKFAEGVHHLENNSSKYKQLKHKHKGSPPKFTIGSQSVAKLSVGAATAERMKAIVRKAQKNFQFALIYEQRKTNQILVAGFRNLAHALDGMTQQILASIDGLTNSVGEMSSRVDDLSQTARSIRTRMDDLHKEYSKGEAQRAEREQKALKMLDNLQRGRKPSVGDA